MLTVKEEMYVQNLLKGMSQREAYKNSYNASRMKDTTIDSKASLLFKKDKVRVRYKELIEATAKPTIMSVQKRKELLSRIAEAEEMEKTVTYEHNRSTGGAKKLEVEYPPDLKTRMNAVDTLNKMDRIYVQTVELGNKEDKPLHIDLSKFTLSQLKELMKNEDKE